ncbi:hypothetical protein KIL84_005439 [Mauremys mutica]|uniref:Uncharacterized protein n=1 Tax=Mauremys mutica TaxID=74926 RepID=A0A9D3XKS2_9SAUR|nr:hypothetical protein KIL84_005439 [Mauremys mutica]
MKKFLLTIDILNKWIKYTSHLKERRRVLQMLLRKVILDVTNCSKKKKGLKLKTATVSVSVCLSVSRSLDILGSFNLVRANGLENAVEDYILEPLYKLAIGLQLDDF